MDPFEEFVNSFPVPDQPVDQGPPPAERVTADTGEINRVFFGSPDGSSPLRPGQEGGIISFSSSISLQGNAPTSNITVFGVNTMPATLYKFTFIVDDTVMGTSMSQILSSVDVMSDGDLKAAALDWMTNVSDAFSNPNATRPNVPSAGYPLFAAVRISQVQKRNQTLIYQGPFAGRQRPLVWTPNSGNQSFNNGINLRLRSAVPNNGTLSTTTFFIPSVPDIVINNNRYDGTLAVSGANSHVALVRLIAAYLASNPRWAWGHLGRNPALVPKNLTNATFVAGAWQFTVSDPSGLAARDVIQISTANARGWNGLYRITSIDAAIVTIAGGPPSGVPGFTSAAGVLYRTAAGLYQQVFYKYTELVGEPKAATRKPSRPFASVSFRRRRSKVKTSR